MAWVLKGSRLVSDYRSPPSHRSLAGGKAPHCRRSVVILSGTLLHTGRSSWYACYARILHFTATLLHLRPSSRTMDCLWRAADSVEQAAKRTRARSVANLDWHWVSAPCDYDVNYFPFARTELYPVTCSPSRNRMRTRWRSPKRNRSFLGSGMTIWNFRHLLQETRTREFAVIDPVFSTMVAADCGVGSAGDYLNTSLRRYL
jgi:hypothetical protein